jgi:hypothetical protein
VQSRADRRSQAQRWHAALAELIALQDDYRTWLDALPQNLEASATAEALRAICDLLIYPISRAWSRRAALVATDAKSASRLRLFYEPSALTPAR